ncbi:MAG: hypothetical protein NC182_07890 [Prevotella sp.]|nr:hypothetical protein [Staphylococcus sp.]MCM1351095.1 hypothetical protein [Prevotella sp.]
MAKLTRNSYKRKIIVFGLMVFMAIALVSTGFAAWIMSTNAKDEQNGNVTVGTVTDSSLKLTDVALSTDSIRFEPKEEDNSGRVRSNGKPGECESLVIIVTGKVSPKTVLGELTVGLTMDEAVKNALLAAETANYIVLPECAKGAVKVETTAVAGSDTEVEFTYTIEFKWGTAFGGMNPGEYFDTEEAGLAKTDEEVKAMLKALRTTIYGLSSDVDDATLEAAQGPSFKVVVSAKAN